MYIFTSFYSFISPFEVILLYRVDSVPVLRLSLRQKITMLVSLVSRADQRFRKPCADSIIQHQKDPRNQLHNNRYLCLYIGTRGVPLACDISNFAVIFQRYTSILYPTVRISSSNGIQILSSEYQKSYRRHRI